MEKIRILFTETYTHVAGGQRGLLDLVAHIDRDRFEPVALVQGPGRLADGLRERRVQTIFRRLEPFRNRWIPGSWNFGVRPCMEVMREVRPHVVHSNHLYVGRYSGRAAHRLGIPCLVTLRLVHEPEVWDRWNRWETLRLHDRVVSNSELGAKVHAGDPALQGKLSAIWNGIDLERFHPMADQEQLRRDQGARMGIPADALVIAQVASMVPQKGNDLLTEAFLRLAANDPRLHLVFVGGAFSRTHNGDALLAMARARGMEDRLHLTDFVWDVPQFLNLADISVLASRDHEGLPRSIIEAMACGNPVVATRVGACSELVEDGVNGFLVEPGSADALESALARLVGDPELRSRMGAEGLRRAQERHDLRLMIRKYQDVYAELAGQK